MNGNDLIEFEERHPELIDEFKKKNLKAWIDICRIFVEENVQHLSDCEDYFREAYEEEWAEFLMQQLCDEWADYEED